MQTKRFGIDSEATIAVGQIRSVEIDNISDRRANWHGIRFWCRIRADNASADNEAHGLVAIMIRPSSEQGDMGEGSFDTALQLENQSELCIAYCPWAVFGGSTNPVGAGTFQDIECVIKTSRTCGKGAVLTARVINNADSAKSVILATAQLSCFETVI